MTNDEVVNELKEKKLPTFGTLVERKDRLKKHYGKYQYIQNTLTCLLILWLLKGIAVATPAIDHTLKDGTNNLQHQPTTNFNANANLNNNNAANKKSSCLEEIERLK